MTERTPPSRPTAGRTPGARPVSARSASGTARTSQTRRPAARRPAAGRAPARKRRTSKIRIGRSQLRLRASLAVVLTLLALLGARMVQLQGLESAAYNAKAISSRTRTIQLPATRGAITDRWGHVLADDLDLRLVFADPTAEKTPQATAAKLAPLLGMDQATLVADLTKPKTQYVVLEHLVPVSVADQVMALGDPGLNDSHETTRDHPDGDLAAALVGITGTSTHGQSGVEELLDSTLSGSAGKEEQEFDPSGRPLPDGTLLDVPAVNGSNVRLTIDRDLQYEAQQALDAQVKASNAHGGQVIVMDPKSGEVLAMASDPEFDASKPVSNIAQLQIPALQTSYEPGSVNKLITASAAIESGTVTPTTALTVPNTFHYPGRPDLVHDAEDHGTEDLTFTGVLAESSNIGTDEVALMLGREKIYSMLKAFGLGEPSGIGYPGETSGQLPNVATWNAAQASTIPFGQGMSVTALQIADAYATIANGGVREPASIVRSTVSPDGTVHPYPAAAGTRVVSKATAATIAHMLEAVTTEGTAPAAKIDGYNVAGKTGTAEAVGTNGQYESGQFVDSFVGFAPADAPRLLVEVVIDHPETGSHFGGDTAAPVFAQVMSYGLREYDVPPTGRKVTPLPICWGAASACPSQ